MIAVARKKKNSRLKSGAPSQCGNGKASKTNAKSVDSTSWTSVLNAKLIKKEEVKMNAM